MMGSYVCVECMAEEGVSGWKGCKFGRVQMLWVVVYVIVVPFYIVSLSNKIVNILSQRLETQPRPATSYATSYNIQPIDSRDGNVRVV